MRDDVAAVLAESQRLLDQGVEQDWRHVEWQIARDADPTFRLAPPVPKSSTPLSAGELEQWQRRTDDLRRDLAKGGPMNKPTTQLAVTRRDLDALVKGLGQGLAIERKRMREHVAKEIGERCNQMEARIRELENARLAATRAEIATLCSLRDEISGLRDELADLRRDRTAGKVIDMPRSVA